MYKPSFIILLLLLSIPSAAQTFNFMTYNLRYENDIDGENIWAKRRDLIQSQIEYYEPDIFGTQEGVTGQIKWLDENLKDYGFVGIGREEGLGGDAGEYSAIFFNDKKFSVIESSTFWLSATPSVVSKGWDAAQYRICTYALLKDKKSSKEFYVFNTHFDHRGDVAREKSAALILDKIKEINKNNLPFALMGDFNLTPDSVPIKLISSQLDDSRTVSLSKPFGPEETFCNWDICSPPEKRIDYIFVGKNKISVNKYATIVDVWNKHYPSDHYPVLINISFNK